jgi:ribosomal protein S18 acetylase RimI-like enzyme
MSEARFRDFLVVATERFAIDKAAVEQTSVPRALEAAQRQITGLLPDGASTPGHFFYDLLSDAGERVGEIWFAHDAVKSEGFIYEVFIAPEFRRHGHGRAAFAMVESKLKSAGCRQIWLNVFATNEPAIAFYRAIGYAVGTIHMTKMLGNP